MWTEVQWDVEFFWREPASGWTWTGGKWDVEFFWHESAPGGMWTGGKWDAEAALARIRDGQDVDGREMGCGILLA